MTKSLKGVQKKKVLPNGRNQSSFKRHIQLHYELLESSAYRSLSSNARSLLIELTMIYNGSNNGFIFLSVRDAADRLGVVDLNVARNAFDELVQMGFIVVTQNSSFDLKYSANNRARAWRLTYKEAQDIETGKHRKATNECHNIEPIAGTLSHKRMLRGQKVLKKYRKLQSQI